MSEQLSLKKRSYGLGDVSQNMSSNMVASFLLYYYTNVALLPVGLIGTLLLFSRVGCIDRPSNWDCARPHPKQAWQGSAIPAYTPIPLGILLIMVFYSPAGSVATKMIYAYAPLILIGIAFSFVNIPYAALMALMTRDANEKMQLGSMRTVASGIGTTIVTALTIPFVNWLGPSRH